MIYSTPDKRRVFLAYRAIFAGQNAKLRKTKKIREVVKQHQNAFPTIIQEFGVNKIVEILSDLLQRQIFESESKAKAAFPEFFQTSPARDVQRTIAENNAAQWEAEALKDVASQDEGDNVIDEKPTGDQPINSGSIIICALVLLSG
jgi:hypothetical protein